MQTSKTINRIYEANLDTKKDLDKKLSELRDTKSQLAILEAKKKKLQKDCEKLLEEQGFELYIKNGIKAMVICRTGSIDYKKIPEVSNLNNDYIDSFRKDDTFFWKFDPV